MGKSFTFRSGDQRFRMQGKYSSQGSSGSGKHNRQEDPLFQKENRKVERIPASLHTRLLYGSLFFTGRVTNISEQGMFIHTEVCFPVRSRITILLRHRNEVLHVPVEVERLVISDPINRGVGVRVLQISREYLEFIIKYYLFDQR